MRKHHIIGAIAGGALVAGAAFAIQGLGGLGKSLGDSTYQIGYLVGSLVGIGSIMIPSMAVGKDQGGGSATTFLSQDTLKYVIPIVFIASVAGIFLGTGADYGGMFTQAFSDGIFHFAWMGFMIQAFRNIAGEVGGGVLKGIGGGVEAGFKKKYEDKIRGKYIPKEYRQSHDFIESMENWRHWGGLATADYSRMYTQGGFGNDIHFLRQAKNVV